MTDLASTTSESSASALNAGGVSVYQQQQAPTSDHRHHSHSENYSSSSPSTNKCNNDTTMGYCSDSSTGSKRKRGYNSSDNNMETDDEEEKLDVAQRRAQRKSQNLETISKDSPASKICEAFFVCMDFDGNGYIEEFESKALSVIAFDRTEEDAEEHWQSMLDTMDSNKDMKISKDEYVTWWTETHAKMHVRPDGSFEEEYGIYLVSCLKKISAVKAANKMCDLFFDAIDTNKDGYLEQQEVKNVSKWAFGESARACEARWQDMLLKMDTNHDERISKDEYRTYWLSKAKHKIMPDGTFVDGEFAFVLNSC